MHAIDTMLYMIREAFARSRWRSFGVSLCEVIDGGVDSKTVTFAAA